MMVKGGGPGFNPQQLLIGGSASRQRLHPVNGMVLNCMGSVKILRPATVRGPVQKMHFAAKADSKMVCCRGVFF